MLSLQLLTHPRINTNNVPSLHKKNTLSSSLACVTAESNKNGSNICSSKFSPMSSPFRFRLAAAASNDSASSSRFDDDNEEKCSPLAQLPEGLEPELMPKHIAVMMDGHRRWAAKSMLPIELAHKAEGKSIKRLVTSCMKLGIKVLTIFAMSTENYKRRPQEEIDSSVVTSAELQADMLELIRQGLKITAIGDKSTLPHVVASVLSIGEEASRVNKGMHLVTAINYGGRYDITQASKKIATKVRDGVLGVDDIDEALFDQHLETGDFEFPHPDLLIRTSGVMRISNFVLWQLAYSELSFVEKLLPDFEEADLVETLTEFQRRKRRYGA